MTDRTKAKEGEDRNVGSFTVALTGTGGPVGAALARFILGHAVIGEADMVSRAAAVAALTRIADGHGTIDAMVHANVPPACLEAGRIDALDDAAWDARGEAPIRATINLMQAAHDVMRDRGGVIIVVQPTIGLAGQKRFAAYAAACEAQRCLVKSISHAWGRHRIRAHTIVAAPEVFGGELGAQASAESTLSPLSFRGRTPEMLLGDICETVRFLISEAAAGLTGTTTAVDGGRWMPL